MFYLRLYIWILPVSDIKELKIYGGNGTHKYKEAGSKLRQ